MKAFSIHTVGCKVNQYETQQIRELLERLGLTRVRTADKPDLIVINTCCVTHTASAKCRQYIRKAVRLNPNAAVVICGCLPTLQSDELISLNAQNVYLIRHRGSIAAVLHQIINDAPASADSINHRIFQYAHIKAENRLKIKDNLPDLPKLPLITSFNEHTRAFIKVQDGCDGSCSYCIIPTVRPAIESKSVEEVLRQVRLLLHAGHREIVITGINLGAYGQKSVRRKNWPDGKNDKLAALLEKIAAVPNLERIRLSSLEPSDVTPRLLDVFCGHSSIMPHLHLSLQSGSNKILKRMCRQYTAEEFIEKVVLIKNRLDNPAITTDIIAGFPGETDADFQQTLALAKKIGFAKMHIFPFSARKGTVAAAFRDTVADEVIKERSRTLRSLSDELAYDFRRAFLGQTATVLTESDNGDCSGLSERYFIVRIEGTPHKKNELVTVKLLRNTHAAAIGRTI